MSDKEFCDKVDDYMKFRLNNEPVCPHCEMEIDIADAEWWDLYIENDGVEYECPNCEKEFTIITVVSYKFTTCVVGK